jgi:hypothetical protein
VLDPPPKIGPEDQLSKTELAELALGLLRELAAQDPALADRMRRLGLDPDPEAPACGS